MTRSKIPNEQSQQLYAVDWMRSLMTMKMFMRLMVTQRQTKRARPTNKTQHTNTNPTRDKEGDSKNNPMHYWTTRQYNNNSMHYQTTRQHSHNTTHHWTTRQHDHNHRYHHGDDEQHSELRIFMTGQKNDATQVPTEIAQNTSSV